MPHLGQQEPSVLNELLRIFKSCYQGSVCMFMSIVWPDTERGLMTVFMCGQVMLLLACGALIRAAAQVGHVTTNSGTGLGLWRSALSVSCSVCLKIKQKLINAVQTYRTPFYFMDITVSLSLHCVIEVNKSDFTVLQEVINRKLIEKWLCACLAGLQAVCHTLAGPGGHQCCVWHYSARPGLCLLCESFIWPWYWTLTCY